MIVYSTNAPQASCLSLWERWHGERRDGEGVILSFPSQSKIKDFCQLSQRESQVRALNDHLAQICRQEKISLN